VRKHRNVAIILLQHPWSFTDRDLSKLGFPNEVLVSLLLPIFARDILSDDIHLDLTNFIDDFLDIEVQKSIERRNLLRYKTMLRKVGSNESPSIALID
jgi:hypothetical protein